MEYHQLIDMFCVLWMLWSCSDHVSLCLLVTAFCSVRLKYCLLISTNLTSMCLIYPSVINCIAMMYVYILLRFSDSRTNEGKESVSTQHRSWVSRVMVRTNAITCPTRSHQPVSYSLMLARVWLLSASDAGQRQYWSMNHSQGCSTTTSTSLSGTDHQYESRWSKKILSR